MRILVWENKYNTEYWDASTPEALETSAREVLRSIVEDYQYIPKPEDPMTHIQYSGIDLEQAQLTDEQIENLPTDSLRVKARKHKAKLASRMKEYENALEEYENVQKLLAGETVLQRWRSRRSHLTLTDEEWNKLTAEIVKKYPDAVVEGNVILRPISAWSILQTRNGYEYEHYTLEEVQTA